MRDVRPSAASPTAGARRRRRRGPARAALPPPAVWPPAAYTAAQRQRGEDRDGEADRDPALDAPGVPWRAHHFDPVSRRTRISSPSPITTATSPSATAPTRPSCSPPSSAFDRIHTGSAAIESTSLLVEGLGAEAGHHARPHADRFGDLHRVGRRRARGRSARRRPSRPIRRRRGILRSSRGRARRRARGRPGSCRPWGSARPRGRAPRGRRRSRRSRRARTSARRAAADRSGFASGIRPVEQHEVHRRRAHLGQARAVLGTQAVEPVARGAVRLVELLTDARLVRERPARGGPERPRDLAEHREQEADPEDLREQAGLGARRHLTAARRGSGTARSTRRRRSASSSRSRGGRRCRAGRRPGPPGPAPRPSARRPPSRAGSAGR